MFRREEEDTCTEERRRIHVQKRCRRPEERQQST
jgi:hypothetical protein